MIKIMFKIRYVFLLIVFNKNIFGIQNHRRYSLYNVIRDNIEFEDYLELEIDERNNVVNNNRNNGDNILELLRICNINPYRAYIYFRATLGCVLFFLLMYNLYKLIYENKYIVNDKIFNNLH